jgi:agmatinase
MDRRGSWSQSRHTGGGGFLGAPFVAPEAAALTAARATHAVYGIPFDGTTFYRTGSRDGPHAIRDASEQFLPYHFDFDVDLAAAVTLVDCGDSGVVPGSAQRTLDAARRDLGRMHAAGVMPIVLGGEHSVTIAGTAALAELFDAPLGLVVFDTHLDTAEEVAGERLTYCAPVSRTLELEAFAPENTCLVGIHGPANPRDEREWAEAQGVRVYAMREIEERGIAGVVEEAMAAAWRGTRGVYVSYDIDCLDASCAPGTSGAEPGGLTTRELLQAVRIVASSGYTAFDVVEVAPQYDPAGITATAACRVILDMLAGGMAQASRPPR